MPRHPFSKLYRGYQDLARFLPPVLRDLLTTSVLLLAAYWFSGLLLQHTGEENNSDLVFTLAVMLISLLTDGYFYGVAAALLSGFFINYFFMYPYHAFSLSYAGYPVAMLSMMAMSVMVCALTSRVKLQAVEAAKREKDAKELYELNAKLNEEKNAIQLQADRETIRGNILRAVSHDLRTPSPPSPERPRCCSPARRSPPQRKTPLWCRTSRATPTPSSPWWRTCCPSPRSGTGSCP